MSFSPVVVAPTYNNAGTLVGVLERLDAQGTPIIVVNDGSTDATPALLDEWSKRRRSHAVHVETHDKNQGKAAALRTGFAAAAKLGYTHAVTIDTDGQLSPEQLPDFLAVARENPDALVLGTRDDTAPDYPGKSRLGRRLANLMAWMECGVRVADSQCGFRVYPVDMPERDDCRAGRYGFETEVIVRAGWAGRPILDCPANCTYFAGGGRVSHFRPFWDTARNVGLHGRLVARALMPGGKRRRQHGSRDLLADPSLPLWRRVLYWLSPRQAWREIRQDRPSGAQRTAMAMAVAAGAFIGCIPVYGLHALLALYTARRLNLNPLGAVLGTQVACPPVGIAIGIAATAVGYTVIEGGIPPLSRFDPLIEGSWSGILSEGPRFFLSWLLGSVVIGFVCMVGMFFLTDFFLKRVPAKGEVVSE